MAAHTAPLRAMQAQALLSKGSKDGCLHLVACGMHQACQAVVGFVCKVKDSLLHHLGVMAAVLPASTVAPALTPAAPSDPPAAAALTQPLIPHSLPWHLAYIPAQAHRCTRTVCGEAQAYQDHPATTVSPNRHPSTQGSPPHLHPGTCTWRRIGISPFFSQGSAFAMPRQTRKSTRAPPPTAILPTTETQQPDDDSTAVGTPPKRRKAGHAPQQALAAPGTSCPGPVFTTEADLQEAVQTVLQSDPTLMPIFQEHGLPTKLLASSDASCFEALAKSVVYQQLHGKAAATIYGRLIDICKEPLTPASVLAASKEQLRGCGLSERKAEYITSLAQKFAGAHLEDSAIRSLPDDELVELLTQVKGVGPWTVHMLCMFSLGRANILPVGDLGVKKGMQELYKLSQLPSVAKMEELASKWAPYRSIGVYYMWRVPTSRQVKTPSPAKKGTKKQVTPNKTLTILPF